MTLLQEGSQGICDTAHYPACLLEFKNKRDEKINQVQRHTCHTGIFLKSPLTLAPTRACLLSFVVFK